VSHLNLIHGFEKLTRLVSFPLPILLVQIISVGLFIILVHPL
jgi:hypothetical protein